MNKGNDAGLRGAYAPDTKEVVGFTPGPWEYVPSTEHHGPYITSPFGSTIADFYVMSQPREYSTARGGPSKPLSFLGEMADPNAKLAAAAPDLLKSLVSMRACCMAVYEDATPGGAVDKAFEAAAAAIAKATK